MREVSFGSPATPGGPVTLRRQVALVMPLSGEELSVSSTTWTTVAVRLKPLERPGCCNVSGRVGKLHCLLHLAAGCFL